MPGADLPLSRPLPAHHHRAVEGALLPAALHGTVVQLPLDLRHVAFASETCHGRASLPYSTAGRPSPRR
eukprot:6470686-Pyramimonas_sp.AAC.1